MKKSFINRAHIEGWVYDHNLQKKESGPNSKNPGTVYITGTLNIATDDELTNVIPIHYTYTTETTKAGKPNATFGFLNDVIEGRISTVADVGQDSAVKVRIDSQIGLNEFYSDKNGTEELVSAKRYEGGFIHIMPKISDAEKDRNYFDVDFLIIGARTIEADEERNLPEKVMVKGYIFDDYRKSLLPVEFAALAEGARNYFLDLGATEKNPVFTRIKGQQISQTIIRTITEESAFGDPSVREVPSSRREYIINWAQPDPYVLGEEDTLTGAELTKMLADRELVKADIKKRQDEYQASKGTTTTATKTTSSAGQNFDF